MTSSDPRVPGDSEPYRENQRKALQLGELYDYPQVSWPPDCPYLAVWIDAGRAGWEKDTRWFRRRDLTDLELALTG